MYTLLGRHAEAEATFKVNDGTLGNSLPATGAKPAGIGGNPMLLPCYLIINVPAPGISCAHRADIIMISCLSAHA